MIGSWECFLVKKGGKFAKGISFIKILTELLQSCSYLREEKISPNEEVSWWSSHCGSAETNVTSIHEDTGLISGLAQGVKDLALL